MHNTKIQEVIFGILVFLAIYSNFIWAEKNALKVKKRLKNEFKSKIILIDSYIKELEEEHKYKTIEIKASSAKELEEEVEFISNRSKEIIKHINAEIDSKILIYKIALKEFENSINKFLS